MKETATLKRDSTESTKSSHHSKTCTNFARHRHERNSAQKQVEPVSNVTGLPWRLAGHTKKVEEDCTAILCVGMGGKVHLLLPELGQQLLTGAWQLNTYTLYPVAQLWADGLNNGNRATLVEIHLQIGEVDAEMMPACLMAYASDVTVRVGFQHFSYCLHGPVFQIYCAQSLCMH